MGHKTLTQSVSIRKPSHGPGDVYKYICYIRMLKPMDRVTLLHAKSNNALPTEYSYQETSVV